MKSITESKGKLNGKKGKLKQKFASISDDDLLLIEGKEEELVSRLQSSLGKTKSEIQEIIYEL